MKIKIYKPRKTFLRGMTTEKLIRYWKEHQYVPEYQIVFDGELAVSKAGKIPAAVKMMPEGYAARRKLRSGDLVEITEGRARGLYLVKTTGMKRINSVKPCLDTLVWEWIQYQAIAEEVAAEQLEESEWVPIPDEQLNREGAYRNRELLEDLKKAFNIPVQYGLVSLSERSEREGETFFTLDEMSGNINGCFWPGIPGPENLFDGSTWIMQHDGNLKELVCVNPGGNIQKRLYRVWKPETTEQEKKRLRSLIEACSDDLRNDTQGYTDRLSENCSLMEEEFFRYTDSIYVYVKDIYVEASCRGSNYTES